MRRICKVESRYTAIAVAIAVYRGRIDVVKLPDIVMNDIFDYI